jgi:hypothetical protein
MSNGDQNTAQVLEELQQICAQYELEVPTLRRAWPKSVKERVAHLRQQRVPFPDISDATKIPLNTLYAWSVKEKKREVARETAEGSRFLQVTVNPQVPSRTEAPITRKRRKYRTKNTSTVTVVMPSGVRLEGLSVEGAIQVAREVEVNS